MILHSTWKEVSALRLPSRVAVAIIFDICNHGNERVKKGREWNKRRNSRDDRIHYVEPNCKENERQRKEKV